MTLENVLYSANGTARTDDGRLDIRVSPAAVSSILIFTLVGRSGSAYCVGTRDLDCLTPCALAFGWRAVERELHPARHSETKCS